MRVFNLKNYVSVHSDVSRSCRHTGDIRLQQSQQHEIYYHLMMLEARLFYKEDVARSLIFCLATGVYRWCSQRVVFISVYPCKSVYQSSTQHQRLRADNTINDKVVFLYDCRLQRNVDILCVRCFIASPTAHHNGQRCVQ